MNQTDFLTLTKALKELGYYINRYDLCYSALGNTTSTLELQKMINTNLLRTQTDAISAVRKNLFIIGSVSANGDFSVSESPVVHEAAATARAECARLAKQNTEKMFVFLRLQGAELVPATPIVSI